MRKTLTILGSSLRLTFQELKNNKTRTALSLLGIAFGIFCIIGVLATVNSLEQNIQNQLKSLGSNSIYIDKWDYQGGNDIPFWKYRARPSMKYEEAGMIRERSELLDDVAFLMQANFNVSYKNDVMQSVSIYGVTEEQIVIQPLKFEAGRYFSAAEFNNGSNTCVMGYTLAESLFGFPDAAIGKEVDIKGQKVRVIGVIAKEGKSFVGMDHDDCVMLTYNFSRRLINVLQSNPIIIAKGKEGVPSVALVSELEGIMRQIRKLSPKQEDNFTLNSVEAISKSLSQSFVMINVVGAIIGGISLIVGMFGIANIMFVTVKERTSVIGLKKAIGAKKRSILFEFLMEAAILCVIGGAFGLLLVYILTLILSGPLNFPVFISVPLMAFTVVLCIVIGILAGIIPAAKASNLDPVVAIRS